MMENGSGEAVLLLRAELLELAEEFSYRLVEVERRPEATLPTHGNEEEVISSGEDFDRGA